MLRRGLLSLVRALSTDASLVSLPPNVQRCEVFRNVVSLDEEELIYAELSRILQREGQTTIWKGSTPEDKVIKHVYLEMFGTEKQFTEVKNWQKREVRHLPGLLWSPTLLRVLSDVAPPLMGAIPDTARVVEHQIPGYEMHVEHPTVGTSFLYLNLLSDTVLDFDDESTGRRGQVLLPSRALLCVSGEARWGFRFGERTEEVHTYVAANGTRRRVETDMRLSVQLWKLNPGLLDGRLLQERLEESMEMAGKRLAEEAAKRVELEKDCKEEATALQPPDVQTPSVTAAIDPKCPLNTFLAAAMENVSGKGVLGGDLAQPGGCLASGQAGAKKTMGDIRQDYGQYKQQFSKVYGILQDLKVMQDSGQPLNDLWLKKKMTESSSVDAEKDREDGFDASDIEGTWDKVDAKARFYKAKLKSMDYDGTAFLNSRMPDISQDAPLDMRSTIRKMAPHVKDGDKILASLPNSG
ncbi:conserved hypothetical protein [Leishmania major strain Friedlin]|uniref:Fe2OG dioxygenase domain-containing protein n=1 Tax=Leishmania major TaxID=5664 RepID=Q4Q3M6_LEIMA|nr:conserved hypothetical protein [Leishmania major strain Friedlin]CAG9581019.1 hypothetical_protein_-_conserved [Leishmania major strain Friedlin]CAJ06862.1 conserved hypothetical protein [Leishmania major strain Friedlin]|eukprot:XP_001686072.1 conserved hypothetical protein [Leishmania major strain Friedlin]